MSGQSQKHVLTGKHTLITALKQSFDVSHTEEARTLESNLSEELSQPICGACGQRVR